MNANRENHIVEPPIYDFFIIPTIVMIVINYRDISGTLQGKKLMNIWI